MKSQSKCKGKDICKIDKISSVRNISNANCCKILSTICSILVLSIIRNHLHVIQILWFTNLENFYIFTICTAQALRPMLPTWQWQRQRRQGLGIAAKIRASRSWKVARGVSRRLRFHRKSPRRPGSFPGPIMKTTSSRPPCFREGRGAKKIILGPRPGPDSGPKSFRWSNMWPARRSRKRLFDGFDASVDFGIDLGLSWRRKIVVFFTVFF